MSGGDRKSYGLRGRRGLWIGCVWGGVRVCGELTRVRWVAGVQEVGPFAPPVHASLSSTFSGENVDMQVVKTKMKRHLSRNSPALWSRANGSLFNF